MNKWVPLDNYHQRPGKNEIVILSDGDGIYYDMVWLDAFRYEDRDVREGWYHINGTEPMDIQPTHWLILQPPH